MNLVASSVAAILKNAGLDVEGTGDRDAAAGIAATTGMRRPAYYVSTWTRCATETLQVLQR